MKRGSFFGAAIGAPWIYGVWLVTGKLAGCHTVVLMGKLQNMPRLRIAKTDPSFVPIRYGRIVALDPVGMRV